MYSRTPILPVLASVKEEKLRFACFAKPTKVSNFKYSLAGKPMSNRNASRTCQSIGAGLSYATVIFLADVIFRSDRTFLPSQ